MVVTGPKFVPSKPTHRLKVKDKKTGIKGVVGAGWLNADGSLTIQLQPGCSLNYADMMDCPIHLFPVDS